MDLILHDGERSGKVRNRETNVRNMVAPMKTETTFCKIEDIQFAPGSGKVTRKLFLIPESFEVVETRTRIARVLTRPDLVGRATKLTKTQYLGILLLRNEINACMGKPVTQEVIFRQLRKEFPKWELKQAVAFFSDISKYRKRYNACTLYASQSPPVLFSFYYNDNGYICHHLRRKDMLSFSFCRDLVRSNKFADPRFHSPKEMEAIRQTLLTANKEQKQCPYTNWIVPSNVDIGIIEQNINKPLFNSITFASGYELRNGKSAD